SDACKCVACDEDRTMRGCKKPHACAKAVGSRLQQILPKWIPRNKDARELAPDTVPEDQNEGT
ncbi:hypothetical protein B0H10DRAFT_1747560, partial [Mycena sp. CBHHK59/15]